ncbi:MAG: HEAT repeat domain-containing protein, partial [Thermoplasmata archaeon]|nr:HEAT repeat domain-containing protein [Thermoplasmata archaeon]
RVRREAIFGLGRSGDLRVAEAVRPFLTDPARRVRVASAVVLGILRDRASVPMLLDRLTSDESWVRPAILVALGRIGDPAAIPLLLSSADDHRGWIRVCALHALGEMRVVAARPVARAHLRDPMWSVRGAAGECLGQVGNADDLPILLETLEDAHPWPRRGAIYALGILELSEASPRIREELRHPAAEVRLAAVWALGRLRDDGAREALVTMLRQVHPSRGENLMLAQGEGGAVRLLSDAEGRLFDTIIQALGRLGQGEFDPFVARAILEARARVTEDELERAARLPAPETSSPGAPPLTLRLLFETALPASADEDELGC